MPDLEATPGTVRGYLGITLGATLAWLTYVSVTALIRVPSMLVIFADYGGALPGITLLLRGVYRWFWAVPALGLLLSLDLLRRPRIPAGRALALFGALAFLGGIMHFVLYEGMFAPLWKLAQVLG